MSFTTPRPGTRKAQAKAMSELAQAQRNKALDDYRRTMIDDPTSTDCKIAMERFILSFRAEHEAMCEVYRAMMAEQAARKERQA